MCSFVPTMTGREPAIRTAGGADTETKWCSFVGSALPPWAPRRGSSLTASRSGAENRQERSHYGWILHRRSDLIGTWVRHRAAALEVHASNLAVGANRVRVAHRRNVRDGGRVWVRRKRRAWLRQVACCSAVRRAQIDRFRAMPSFVAPGPAFDAVSRLRGKTIFEDSDHQRSAVHRRGRGGHAAGGRSRRGSLGHVSQPGQPQRVGAGSIRTAIAEHADAITLLAQDPRLLAPQIAEARRAGIPVVVARTTGEGESCQTDAAGRPYGSACVAGPFERAGRFDADWVTASSGGHADVLVVTSNDARSTVPLTRGLMDEFRVRCPACDLRFVDVPIPRWATQLRGEVQSALVRDPGLNYVIPIYDSMSQRSLPRSTRRAPRTGSGSRRSTGHLSS